MAEFKEIILKVNDNFLESSLAWRKNKKSIGNGAFEYVCGYPKKNGEPCRAPPKTFKKQFRCEFKQTWSYCMDHTPKTK